MNMTFKLGMLIFSTTLLCACEGPFAKYSDQDLRVEYSKCDLDKLNAVGIQRCKNILEECETRKKDKGFRC